MITLPIPTDVNPIIRSFACLPNISLNVSDSFANAPDTTV